VRRDLQEANEIVAGPELRMIVVQKEVKELLEEIRRAEPSYVSFLGQQNKCPVLDPETRGTQ